MFKNLMQFWKGKDFLSEVLGEFKGMLEETEDMFNSVCKKLIYSQDEPGLQEKIYAIDKKVNKLERCIRKRVVEHLSLQPSVEVPVSLLLMSVVKDAERLGDYAKNLFEVNNLLHKPLDKAKYEKLFNGIDQEILKLFNKTKEAFLESDEDQAASSWAAKKEIGERSEEIIKKLSTGDLSVNEAVCFTLMARYFKRLAAHLTNIATSVILPISDLDYYDENKAEGE